MGAPGLLPHTPHTHTQCSATTRRHAALLQPALPNRARVVEQVEQKLRTHPCSPPTTTLPFPLSLPPPPPTPTHTHTHTHPRCPSLPHPPPSLPPPSPTPLPQFVTGTDGQLVSLGAGSHGAVFLARLQGTKVAVKVRRFGARH